MKQKLLLFLLIAPWLLINMNAQASWSPVNVNTNLKLESVFITPNGKVFVGGEGGFLSASTDGGNTWSPIALGHTEDVEDIYFFNDNEGMLLFGDFIMQSTDGGITWLVTITLSGNLKAFDFPDATHGYAVGDIGQIMASTDGGATWVPQVSGTSLRLDAVSFSDNMNGYAVGRDGANFFTVNGGQTWNSGGIPGTDDWGDVFFFDSASGWIAGKNGSVYNTTDAGDNWVPQSTSTTVGLDAVHFIDSQTGFISGEDGVISRTLDGGNNWTADVTNTFAELNNIFVQSLNYGFAVGDGGVVLRLGSISTGIENMDENFSLAVYPNPVTDYLRINSGNASADWVMVSNSLGDLMEMIEYPQPTIKVDLSGLIPGVYYATIKLQDGKMKRYPFIKQ